MQHATEQSRLRRLMRYIPLIAPVLLWPVPCWVLLHAGQHWPLPVALGGTALFVLGLIGMPLATVRGHGGRQQDWAAIAGDTLLGTIWTLFPWSVLLGVLLRLALTVTGVGDGQNRARMVTGRSSAQQPCCSSGCAPRPAGCHACADSTYNSGAWGPGWTEPASPSSPTPTTARSTAPAGRDGYARR